MVDGDDNPETCSRPPSGSSLNEQQQSVLEVLVAFAVIIKSVYHITGAPIKDGYKSVAYNIVFRAKDKTLEEADIAPVMKKILHGLSELGIELRQ